MKSFRLIALFLAVAFAIWLFSDPIAQPQPTHPAAAQSQPTPRPGVPSFWQAMDTTLTTWSAYVQGHFPLWFTVVAALLLAYLSGLIVFNIAFSMGSFGPSAAAAGMWVLTFVLFCCGVLLLPLTWPWWAPFALFLMLIFFTAILLTAMSKKAVS